MSALDELRSMLAEESYEDERLAITILEWRSVEQVLDAFESAHPGLEDHTIHCKTEGCKAVTHWGGNGWETGRGCWNQQWWLCPTCAKEAR